jgi:hypothetical protein
VLLGAPLPAALAELLRLAGSGRAEILDLVGGRRADLVRDCLRDDLGELPGSRVGRYAVAASLVLSALRLPASLLKELL